MTLGKIIWCVEILRKELFLTKRKRCLIQPGTSIESFSNNFAELYRDMQLSRIFPGAEPRIPKYPVTQSEKICHLVS